MIHSSLGHVHKGVIKLPPTQNDEEILIPGFPNSIDASDVPSFVISPEAERIVEMLANQFSNLDKVDCVLINSFYELEKEVKYSSAYSFLCRC